MNKLEADLRHAIALSAERELPYLQQWLFDNPIIISRAKFDQSTELQTIFFKLINEFVINFEKYKRLMPLSPKVQKIIDIWQEKADYEIGTYRTDFVFDEQSDFRPIEITCRFAMNGYFSSSILNTHIDKRISDGEVSLYLSPYDAFLGFFISKLQNKNRVFVLRDNEYKNESKFFEPILRDAGLEVLFLTVNDLNTNQYEFDECLIINELNFDELMALEDSVHYKLSNTNFINDLRTVFLVHDKRFFAAINDEMLQRNCLTTEEIEMCKKLFIPSEMYSKDSKYWRDAKHNKDHWILKHRALGKSKSIYAGLVTDKKEWDALFNRSDINDFVLQQWVPQKTYTGSIKNREYNDYITGTFLFCNNNNFGFAEFRTSSFPVTNIVDHRKSVSMIVANDRNYPLDNLQNFNNIGLI